MKDEHPSGKVHVCSACGRESIWGPTWAWYGSYKQMEDGLPIFKACSDDCMATRCEVEARDQTNLQHSELQIQLKHAMREVEKIQQRIAALDTKTPI